MFLPVTIAELPENSPRYVLISYELNHPDGRKSFPLVIINWAPLSSEIGVLTLHASAFLEFQGAVCFHATGEMFFISAYALCMRCRQMLPKCLRFAMGRRVSRRMHWTTSSYPYDRVLPMCSIASCNPPTEPNCFSRDLSVSMYDTIVIVGHRDQYRQ